MFITIIVIIHTTLFYYSHQPTKFATASHFLCLLFAPPVYDLCVFISCVCLCLVFSFVCFAQHNTCVNCVCCLLLHALCVVCVFSLHALLDVCVFRRMHDSGCLCVL
eukprot:GHVS01055606.1.p1 GENE.GHVS01055606.1~~GHVS01055606.1.p1  ORF type:complete len:107 (+),score=6.23 GHVS01055606.1:338-658(+)